MLPLKVVDLKKVNIEGRHWPFVPHAVEENYTKYSKHNFVRYVYLLLSYFTFGIFDLKYGIVYHCLGHLEVEYTLISQFYLQTLV